MMIIFLRLRGGKSFRDMENVIVGKRAIKVQGVAFSER
jgi:hypothetical protein